VIFYIFNIFFVCACNGEMLHCMNKKKALVPLSFNHQLSICWHVIFALISYQRRSTQYDVYSVSQAFLSIFKIQYSGPEGKLCYTSKDYGVIINVNSVHIITLLL